MPKVAVSSATGYGIVDRRMHASGPVTRHPTRPVAVYGTADRRMHARDPVTKLPTWPVTVYGTIGRCMDDISTKGGKGVGGPAGRLLPVSRNTIAAPKF